MFSGTILSLWGEEHLQNQGNQICFIRRLVLERAAVFLYFSHVFSSKPRARARKQRDNSIFQLRGHQTPCNYSLGAGSESGDSPHAGRSVLSPPTVHHDKLQCMFPFIHF